jgi:hypothetical protein
MCEAFLHCLLGSERARMRETIAVAGFAFYAPEWSGAERLERSYYPGLTGALRRTDELIRTELF